jgi:hypothetical protein
VEDAVKGLGIFTAQNNPFTGFMDHVLGKMHRDGGAGNADPRASNIIADVIVMPEIVIFGIRAAILPRSDSNKTTAIEATAGWQGCNIGSRA